MGLLIFSSLLIEVIATDKEDVAFKDLDVAILVGSMPRKEGMERKDLLKANVKIFKSQGTALDKYAKKTVKVNISDIVYCLTPSTRFSCFTKSAFMLYQCILPSPHAVEELQIIVKPTAGHGDIKKQYWMK